MDLRTLVKSERLFELNKRMPSTLKEQALMTHDIASLDREIDKLVYEL